MTAPAINIQALQADNVSAFVDVIRRGFDVTRINMTIYGCPGITNFIQYQMCLPDSLSNKLYLTALNSGQVAGCLEMRSLPDGLFLDYIATLPDYRTQGVATQLFAQGIEKIRQKSYREIHLDVFADNDAALQWYTRLGFAPVHTTNTWAIPLESQPDTLPVTVMDYPQAVASQNTFGFSQFRLITSDHDYSIGRLGDLWFRVTNVQALVDPAVGATLLKLDGRRRILALIDEDTALPDRLMPAAHLLTRTLRMRASLDTVISKLGAS